MVDFVGSPRTGGLDPVLFADLEFESERCMPILRRSEGRRADFFLQEIVWRKFGSVIGGAIHKHNSLSRFPWTVLRIRQNEVAVDAVVGQNAGAAIARITIGTCQFASLRNSFSH